MKLFGLALLLLCARSLLGDFTSFAQTQDVDFYDEAHYLAAGVEAHRLSDLNPQYAPPYSLWYRALTRLSGDMLIAYHLNAYVIAYALPISWYLLCLALGISPLWALVSALAWLCSRHNLDVLRVGSFAGCIVFASLALSAIVRRAWLSWWIAIAGFWLAAFVRPEFSYAALIATGLGAWRLSRESAGRKITIAWIAAVLAPAMILIALFGVPLSGDRSVVALHQALASNLVRWHHLSFVDWVRYEDLIRRYGPLPSGVADFAVHQPLQFAHHVLTNLWFLVTERIPSALRPSDELAAASGAWSLLPIGLTLLGSAAGMLRREARATIALTPASAVLGSCSLFILAAAAVIYAREHYITVLLAAGLLVIAPRASQASDRRWPAAAMIAVAALALSLPSYAQFNQGRSRVEERMILALRALGPGKVRGFFDAFAVDYLFLDPPAVGWRPRDLDRPFDQFLEAKHIDAVAGGPLLDLDERLHADASWQHFRAAPGDFGFRCAVVAGTKRVLCVRSELAQ